MFSPSIDENGKPYGRNESSYGEILRVGENGYAGQFKDNVPHGFN